MGLRRRGRKAFLFIAPFFILYLTFNLYPILYSLYLSFCEMDPITGATSFAGLAHYIRLVESGYFWNSIKNTVVIWGMSIVPQLLLGFTLSLLLNNRWLHGRFLFRNVYYFPNLVTPVTIGLLFGALFAFPGGAINQILGLLGAAPTDFQHHPFLAQVVLAIAICWKNFGCNIVFFSAGLHAIPAEIYEAADMDGAGRLQRTLRITLPLMRPMLIYVMITSIIGGLQIFDEAKMVFKEVPGDATTTMVKYMYDAAFDRLQFGYGAAVSFGIFLVIVVFSLVGLLVTRQRSRRGEGET